MKRILEVIIKENNEFSTVGIRFEKDNEFVGDYEKFDCQELTNEQTIGAVQRLLEKLLPDVPKVEEEEFIPVPAGASRGKFKRTPDGKFVLA